MMIIIQPEDSRAIRLWLPTRIIFSKMTLRLVGKYLDNMRSVHDCSGGTEWLSIFPPESLDEAFRILRKMKKLHPDVPLIDIQEAGGTSVVICL